jgi:hypothetical protein
MLQASAGGTIAVPPLLDEDEELPPLDEEELLPLFDDELLVLNEDDELLPVDEDELLDDEPPSPPPPHAAMTNREMSRAEGVTRARNRRFMAGSCGLLNGWR